MESELRKFFFDNWRGSRNFAAQTGARPSAVLKRESGVSLTPLCVSTLARPRAYVTIPLQAVREGVRSRSEASQKTCLRAKMPMLCQGRYSDAGLRGRAQSLIRPEIPAGNMGALRAARSGGCGNSICDMFHPRPCPPLRKEHNTFVRCHKHLRHF